MNEKPSIVVTNRIFAETAERLATVGTVVVNPSEEPWPRDELLRHASQAEAVMAFMTDRIDAAFLAACPKLKIIAAALKGYDNIDVAAAERAGVWVSIVPDLLTAPTAELAIALMLALGRHVLASDRRIRAEGFHGWRPTFYGRGLAGATVGIIGYGAVGRAIARRLSGFDCRILATDLAHTQDETADLAPFEQIIALSDYIVLALPLTSATKYILDRATIARMKPGALLVNPARGSLVDESAVADALASGRLAGYAADVFQCEDWAQADRPSAIDPRLIAPDAPTVLTSHIGSAVTEVRRAIEASAAESIVAALSGREPRELANFRRK
jgi:phosphonate dehydrogenase